MANFFTKQQIDDIRTALASDAKSDLELPETTEITNNDYVAIVQNGLNKKIKADSFKGETGATGPQGPQGPQGIQGPEGQQGPQGDPGITSASVTVDNTSGTPTATATITNQNLNIAFTGLKGPQGEQGPAGQDGQDGSDADVTATNITNALGYTPASQDSDAVAGNVAEFDASGNPKDSGVAADNIAEQDGYYETLVAGAAENLIGRGTVPANYTRRRSGGGSIGSGAAVLEEIQGNTLGWNQMVKDWTNSANWKTTGTTTAQMVSGKLEITFNASGSNNAFGIKSSAFVAGHKVLIMAKYSGTQPSFVKYGSESGVSSAGNTLTFFNTEIRTFNQASSGDGAVWFWMSAAATFTVEAFYVIDLTQMGYEPSTVAEFEALFPLKYYNYDAGSLLNFTGTGLQTNGFQQWDEEWEVGSIDSSGQNTPSTTRIRSKNYIPVFPSTTYYYRIVQNPNTASDAFFYDAEKNFISQVSSFYINTTFTTPANCYYMRFVPSSAYGTTYKNNICINFSDSAYNGNYEPYWSETHTLPITTATSGGVAVFPDGEKSAGTAHDRYYKSAGSDLFNKAEKVIGKVDLGTLNWQTNGSAFSASISDIKHEPNANSMTVQMLLWQYTRSTANAAYSGASPKIYGLNQNGTLFIYDSNYSTPAAFKTAMDGVWCFYELATPTDYTLDTPFSAQYRVDGMGTETLLPENTATPTTTPINAEVKYPMNAVDTLRNLPQGYISKASMDAILTAFKTAGVITNYTLTWDATNQKYNCSITV